VMGEVMASVNASGEDITSFRVRPADLAQLIRMVRDGKVSGTAAKTIFRAMTQSGDRPEQIAVREGLLQVGDDDALAGWIDEVIAENPDEARRFSAGERKLQGVLVGLVMKKSKGRADPKRVNQLLSSRAG
jgi:aspartyl-tRNA(Asn)/glutamyl-tRNA(Gln) amidotransferase subunit B